MRVKLCKSRNAPKPGVDITKITYRMIKRIMKGVQINFDKNKSDLSDSITDMIMIENTRSRIRTHKHKD